MALRLATYNIHRCIGRDGRENPRRIAAVLRAMDADLVALQEVAFDPDTPSNHLQYLADAAGARVIPGPTLMEKKGRYGNALLTRMVPQKVERLDISEPNREPRGVIEILLAVEGKTVLVVATHLGLSFAERRKQMNRIVARLASASADVSILMGDFNEWHRWGGTLRRLQKLFGPLPAPATFPSRYPLLALDRILVRPAGLLTAVKAFRGASAPIASDHLPLTAQVVLP
ncbi:MAG: endonuclease/exonuclease/phosphatase family protein [Desulfobacterales bacterium]|jgi:endonuclease/exonuclease/phosphatase family metal-dependent hydrolase